MLIFRRSGALISLAVLPVIGPVPISFGAPTEAELAMKRFQAPPGLKVDLWAAEPMLANPVSFVFDEKGQAYVCESFRLGAGVDDIRGIMPWLDEELAARSVSDREAEMKRHLGDRFARYTEKSERLRLLEDCSGSGKADRSVVYADGFNTPLDGLGAGVLARQGNVWYANIPNLWLLRDTNGDGAADFRKSLHYGFGVRVGFLGHDLHGPRFGPDGKLYFSVGDRGSSIRVADGQTVGYAETGCVFRCEPDGSDLEVFAYGLRNPQDLVFDQYGNLFTGDNNSDSGDQARWVYLVEGGDSGWRVGFQFMERPYSRGAFNAERLWYPHFPGQAAHIIPPIANISSGPSGLAYFPGTGLPASYKDHFFLVDFRGGAVNSGVHTFTLDPHGAGFKLSNPERFLWGVLATDAKFGVDGGLYVTDWVEGWGLTGKGRIYRVHAPELDADSMVVETKRLLAQDFGALDPERLGGLLEHPDMRIRQEAQFALATKGSRDVLMRIAAGDAPGLARLHAIWGLGQMVARYGRSAAADPGLPLLAALLSDPDSEVRAQAAKVLGDCRYGPAAGRLVRLLQDSNPRVQFFAAIALGKCGDRDAVPPILALLRHNGDRDPYLRHAAVMALTRLGDVDALVAAVRDPSRAARIGVLLAMRRLQRPEIAMFLSDSEPAVVLEAARAINDEPINAGAPDLAALLGGSRLKELIARADFVPESVARDLSAAETARLGPEALIRRVLNANFRLGTLLTARALIQFAADNAVDPAMRVEALEELADWAHPSGRDRIIGLWRPPAGARTAEDAIQAVEPHVTDLLSAAPDTVRVALLRAIGRLKMTASGSAVERFVANTNEAGPVRAEALLAIADMQLPGIEQALDASRADPSPELRRAATRLEGRLKSARALPRLTAALETGSPREQQSALAALAALPGEAVDDLVAQWLDRLRGGNVPRELRLDILQAAEARTAQKVRRKLQRVISSRSSDDPLAAFEETLFGGDAAEGKRIFFEKAEAQCVRCHKIGKDGGDVGPDLTHIGSQQDRKYLLESIVLPNHQIAKGYESVTVFLKNGDSYAGVLKSETADEIVINSADTGVLPIKKSDVESRRASLSPMPEGLGQILSNRELRDLVEFLSEQK